MFPKAHVRMTFMPDFWLNISAFEGSVKGNDGDTTYSGHARKSEVDIGIGS